MANIPFKSSRVFDIRDILPPGRNKLSVLFFYSASKLSPKLERDTLAKLHDRFVIRAY